MSNSFSQKKRNYYKRNMVEAVEIITPNLYEEEDLAISGTEIDPTLSLINSHLNIANNISDILYVSSVAGTIFSALDTFDGISPFFVKQNQLTVIKPSIFEREILVPLGKSFRNFPTSASLATYLETDFLPGVITNSPSATGYGTQEQAHVHLTSSLSWLYFLNTSADGGLAYSPSSFVKDTIITKLYKGNKVTLNDSLKGVNEFILKNIETCSTWSNLDIIPTGYLSSTGTYTSGVQQLEKLNTLVDAVYSPLYLDSKDTKVKESFENFGSTGSYHTDLVSKGPFRRLIKAFSFLAADVYNQIDQIETFNDIDECPENLLPYLAELIGWKLFGHDPNRWRLQLQNAVGVYKAAGTKRSIQLAVNSVFPRESFDVESNIQELWESYIPFLIYYSLATESSLLKSYKTWTFDKARSLGVDRHTKTSMDENVRIVVDNIILSLVRKFPDLFVLGLEPFPLGDPSFVFHYRGRDFQIPPFEEIPYYLRTDITESLIMEIVDLLVCFGVRQSFALQVGDFIRDNTIKSTDNIREGNGWLMFTSSMEVPPNWNSIISDITPGKEEYFGLWSGKSSHYQLDFEAANFDFTKETLEVDSKLAIIESARLADEFAPADAIRNTRLFISGSDNYSMSSTFPVYALFDKRDDYAGGSSALGLVRFESSGVNIGNNTFNRESADSIKDTFFSSTSYIVSPRNSFRRRNYKHTLEEAGFYDRRGFNMPVSWDASVLERSTTNSLGFLPLGFIPSACAYQDISDYNNLPDVYGRCEGLNSSSNYFGVDVSATFPCRGLSALGSDAKHSQHVSAHANYVDRGQLDPFLATIHSIDSRQELLVSSSNLSGTFSDYTNYSFGKGIHDLFRDYTEHLGKHILAPIKMHENGTNIFAHAFGSIFRNSDFTEEGELVANSSSLIARRVDAAAQAVMYYDPQGIFGTPAGTSSTLNLSASTDAPYDEYRSEKIISGVEYIIPSGAASSNHIATYDLHFDDNIVGNTQFSLYNPLIKMKSVSRIPRIAFDLRSYFDQDNVLIPNHIFDFSLKATIGNEKVSKMGGASLGVWIHTPPENGLVWTFMPNGKWELIEASNITKEKLIGSLSHITSFPNRTRATSSGTNFKCFNSLDASNPIQNHGVIPTYSDDDFSTIKVRFNTTNKVIAVPESYYKNNEQVHRVGQNYRIEVFMLPNNQNKDKFLLIDNVNLLDVTQNNRTKIAVSGVANEIPFKEYCDKITVNLTREELWSILKHFRGMIGDLSSRNKYSSRDASDTSSIMEVSGGSRINYRLHTDIGLANISDIASGISAVGRYQDINIDN